MGRAARNRRLWERPDKVLRRLLWGIPAMISVVWFAWSTGDEALRVLVLAGALFVLAQTVAYSG